MRRSLSKLSSLMQEFNARPPTPPTAAFGIVDHPLLQHPAGLDVLAQLAVDI